jgi:hypothetical protein
MRTTPVAPSARPLEGAPLADRRSRFRGGRSEPGCVQPEYRLGVSVH